MNSNRKKIMIFNTLYPPNVIGGAELSVQSIAESVCDKFDVYIVASSDNNSVEKYYINNIQVINIPAFNFGYRDHRVKNIVGKFFWNLLEVYNPVKDYYLLKLIEDINPDLIHTNNLACLSVSIWEIAKSKNIPIVHTLRDKWLLCSRRHMFKSNAPCKDRCFGCKLLNYRAKKYSNYVDCVVGISSFILNEHIKYGYFSKSEKNVIYNCVDCKVNVEKNKINKFTFGYIGSITNFKGVEFLTNSKYIGSL